MKKWLKFFVGSPKRAIVTGLVGLFIAAMINPSIPQQLFRRVGPAMDSMAGLVIAILILGVAYKKIVGK